MNIAKMVLCNKTIAVIPVLLLLSSIISLSAIRAATLTEITGFGANPTKLKMFLYVPDNVKPHPAVLVGIHWCHGTAQAYFTGNSFRTLANQYGFIVIYPNANSSDSCFDVHSAGTLSHDGGGDAQGIVSMVKYVINNKNGDPTRVYATGHSSGGMMTNVLAGSYPEVFSAAAASAGVPFGCFGGGTNSWNDSCAKGRITKTAAAWGDMVRAAYPGYTGLRPRMQLWHGVNDDILSFVNFEEAIKQWSNVLGVSGTPAATEINTPKTNYTRMRHTNDAGTVMIEAIRGAGQSHNITIVDAEVIKFFELDKTVFVHGQSRADPAPQCAASLIVKPSERGISITVAVNPGTIRIDLYNLSGAKIATIADRFCADGKIAADWAQQSPGAGIVSVKVEGTPVVQRRWAVLASR